MGPIIKYASTYMGHSFAMIIELSIKNFLLIEGLTLDFRTGLSVLTGETGAGKSILLGALGFVLGDRADSRMVAQGADSAVVSASFEIRGDNPLIPFLHDNAIEMEEGEPLHLRRQLRVDGRSRAFINDNPCSANILRKVGGFLVEIHGQHDDRGLMNVAMHRQMLDRYGDIATMDLRDLHKQWHDANNGLEYLIRQKQEEEAELDLLTHQVEELRQLAPVSGEEKELADIRAMMMKAEKLTDELGAIMAHFEGSESGFAFLRMLARQLDRVSGEHIMLSEALQALDRAIVEAEETERHIRNANDLVQFDAEKFDQVETRLFDLRAFARKHRTNPDALPTILTEMEERLEQVNERGDNIERLQEKVSACREAFIQKARVINGQRRAAARQMSDAVNAQLEPLKLGSARFVCSVEELAEPQWTANGLDAVSFQISTNPGAPLGPIGKIASGGELSRFILALKVALAEQDMGRTMIFDEIDRGVGGAVAAAIGERLSRLAQSGGETQEKDTDKAQILVVTHSPQVAARGTSHFLVDKKEIPESGRIHTKVTALDDNDRLIEIARMLSADEITEEAKAQAARLLGT